MVQTVDRYRILRKKLQPNTISQLVIPGHGGKRLRDVGGDISRGSQHPTIRCVSLENAPVPAQGLPAMQTGSTFRGSSHPLSSNARPWATTCDRPRVGGRYRIPHTLHDAILGTPTNCIGLISLTLKLAASDDVCWDACHLWFHR